MTSFQEKTPRVDLRAWIGGESADTIFPELVSMVLEQFSESREEIVDRRRAAFASIVGQYAVSTLYFLLLWLL
jgi:hypothetical protein